MKWVGCKKKKWKRKEIIKSRKEKNRKKYHLAIQSHLKSAYLCLNLIKYLPLSYSFHYHALIIPLIFNSDYMRILILWKVTNLWILCFKIQGHKQWVAEVQFLGVVEHPNLVKLIGYCAVDEERGIQRLLVYEYMPNKSLENHLFNRAYPTLPWKTRLQILLGAAQGLAYLHEGLEVQVVL